MKHLCQFQVLLRFFVVMALFNTTTLTSFGQQGGSKDDSSMEEPLQPYEILATDAIGNPTFIDFISTKVKSDDKSVYEFLKTVYGFDENTTFVEKPNSYVLQNEIHSKKLFQHYKGIKVEWGQIVITYKDGFLRSVNGHFTPTENNSIVPLTPVDNAIKNTIQKIGAEEYAWENMYLQKMLREETQNPKATYYPTADLLLMDKNITKKDTDVRLVYKFDIYALSPESHKEYFVDASTGEIIYEESLIMHATGGGETRYSGKQTFENQFFNGSYRLHDYTRGNGIITYDLRGNDGYSPFWDFTDNDNHWTSAEHANAARDDAALDAHWGAEMTYDYFLEKHGRNSWDGTGKAIINYVHSSIDNNWVAVWRGNGHMEYGDNNGNNPWTSIDIVGHEFAHGLENATSSLSSFEEGGSLQEGLSDIWGAMVTHYAKPNDPNTYINGGDISLIRDLSNPHNSGTPSTYLNDALWLDYSERGARHVNSTILSHWFYILAEGKTGTNDNEHSYDVQGIGKEKAARIVYRAETVHFTSEPTFGYKDARIETIKAANDIFGAGSIEAKTVCQAWYAVGVGGNECSTRIISGNGGFGGGNDPTNQPSKVDVICDRGNKTYSLLFVDATSTVVWEVSPNLEKMNETSLSVTVRGRLNGTLANTLGHAYVIAIVDGVAYRQDIWIGEPQVEMRYEQTIPYQVYVHLEGANGTDVTKQGISNIDWQLVNPTGNCTPTLDIYNPNVFVALVQANCYNWAAQMQVGVTNECGTIPFVRNITSDGYLGGGGGVGLPCYDIITDLNGNSYIIPCKWDWDIYPTGRNQIQIQQFTIHDYMGVNYGTYENTNVLPNSKLPFGLYFIKGIDKEGNLFTLKYLKK
ncbi:M4 family metallopeptidase [Bernardetia sp. OM2101]|uniref:M4 family metallopeptidase n=1 Tax=Bernardetia sp. OM2101 TaxID=3344876 RepID=UPI0035D0A1DE